MSLVFLNLVCSTCLWTVWGRSNVDNPGKSQIFWQAMPNKVSSLGGANARVRMSKIWRQWKILCSYRASSEEVDVDEIHVIQCSLKDSLLQRSGQIHGPLEYSVQSWHVHLVGKSVQDWPREKNWREITPTKISRIYKFVVSVLSCTKVWQSSS